MKIKYLMIPLLAMYIGCNQQENTEEKKVIEKTKNMTIIDEVDDEPDSALTLTGIIKHVQTTPSTSIMSSTDAGSYHFNYVQFQNDSTSYILAEPYPEPVFPGKCTVTFRPLHPGKISTSKFNEIFLDHDTWFTRGNDTTKIIADGIIINNGIKYK
jgi:hypothetical protein